MATKPGKCPKCKTTMSRDASTREHFCLNCGRRESYEAVTMADVEKVFSEVLRKHGLSEDNGDGQPADTEPP